MAAYGSKKIINIGGFSSCIYFKKVVQAVTGLTILYPSNISVSIYEHATNLEYKIWLDKNRNIFGSSGLSHKSSPIVWLDDGTFVGGCDTTLEWCRHHISLINNSSKTNSNVGRLSGSTIPWGSGKANHGYDYDLVVIGGGSGGLACSQEAKKLGAKVAVLDFVKPSPQGSTWGLGGTCVNVGCIPKKLMHTAALLGEYSEEALEYGWVPESQVLHQGMLNDNRVHNSMIHSWIYVKDKIQDHIKGLNFGYRVKLREVGVTYLKKLGKFIDTHTLECTDDKGKKQNITSANFVIAVGGRPANVPDCEGNEFCLTSDDIFSKETPPLKTCVIGAGYVALETAGFLTNLKQGEVTVLVRSMCLRGFDRDTVERVKMAMESQGTKILEGIKPSKIEKLPSGKFLVHYADDKGCDEFDTVISAVGREADTKNLGLENINLPVNPANGKIKCCNEQTVISNVYAVGDVVDGVPELTPSAILAGKLLARRLFKTTPITSSDYMKYENIATTVFTPLELGTVGLSEEAAISTYGRESIDCYMSEFVPLEWSILEKQNKMKCFAKIVVNTNESNKILGMHIASPNAGEIMQGFGAAIRKGITHDDLLQTVGIHPTVAEEFTLLTISKLSGAEFKKTSC